MTPDQPGSAEDRLLEELLDRLDRAATEMSAGEADSATARLSREYTELLGLLPFEIEPVAPSREVKRRLMAAVAADQVATAGSRAPGIRRVANRWSLPLAAALAVALLGVSGWQFVSLARQRHTIELLAERLSEARSQSLQLADIEAQLSRAQEKLSLVTSKGVEVCTLHAVEEPLLDSPPRGTLFVAADHQHWYLRIEGLAPCPEGRDYQLWFIRDNGVAESGGLLEVEPGVGLEVTSATMPPGTVAVSVTLEPAGGSTEPSGPSVLYGDEVMRIL